MSYVFITHSYVGTSIGRYRYLFFLLYMDYIELQTEFVRSLNLELERLARNLGTEGAVVAPFPGDVETTRSHVLDKDWTENERLQIMGTPAMLIIDSDFDTFSPRSDPWVLLRFDEALRSGSPSTGEIRSTLEAVTEVANDPNAGFRELFDLVREYEALGEEEVEIFHARPGVFGFSIDLKAVGNRFKDWILIRRRPTGQL